MSETAIPQPVNAHATASSGPSLWQAVLWRALVALAFGLVTVFWAEPGAVGLCVAFALYLLALAGTEFLTVRALALPRGDNRRLVLLGATALLAMGAVAVAIFVSDLYAAWFAAAALAVLGAAELYSALSKSAGTSVLRSDWIISGVLGLGTGLLLPFFIQAGPHGLLGVAGGGALMSGALWTLSALTMRHDGGKAKAQ
ncbi:hypothetical protein SAMN04489740_3162 [Arthrobacter alpinus]|uniref:HdeD family acid-resistance protein n=1 Tax=Arthrobacter alpinus TaxID=656366 RepID=A0A1H5MV33_9MICC|nr:hypothetical protein [Arthrobacter alpinus]SEE93202.1 hypothetical protein SAMN04489740_3162 [Arthrobacter alpinus]